MAPHKSIVSSIGSLFKPRTIEDAEREVYELYLYSQDLWYLSTINSSKEKSATQGPSSSGDKKLSSLLSRWLSADKAPTKKDLLQLEITAMKDPKTFSIKGLPLSYFLVLIDQWGGRSALSELTTTEVCDRFLKPLTEGTGLSLCAQLYLSADGKVSPKVQDAKWFISHAWKYKFLDVVDALINFSEKEGLNADETIFWFDLFSNSQHGTAEKNFEWWETVFMNAVKSIGNVVMVLEPWSDPIPLKRVWCIFEVYASSVTKSKFHVAMTNATEEAFLKELQDAVHNFNTVLSNVNSMKSESWNPADKESIFEVVKKTIGFAKLDRMVFETMSEWTISMLRRHYASSLEQNDESVQLEYMHNLGSFLFLSAKYEESTKLLTVCLDKRVALLGLDHPDTLKTMIRLAFGSIANVKLDNSQLDDIEPLVLDSLKHSKKVFGKNHRESLKAMQLASQYYQLRGKLELAEPIFVECLQISRILLGDEHQDTIQAINSLGTFRLQQSKLIEAEKLFKESAEIHTKTLGINHPETQVVLMNLALIYNLTRRETLAEPILRGCIESFSRTLGPDHPDVSNPILQLADTYFRQRRWKEAEVTFQRAYDIRSAAFGPDEEDALRALYHVAYAMRRQGRYKGATELFEFCKAECIRSLGYGHIITKECIGNLRIIRSLGN